MEPLDPTFGKKEREREEREMDEMQGEEKENKCRKRLAVDSINVTA